METFFEDWWFGIFVALWCAYYWLFGMQRTSLLISRHSGIEWRGGGELVLPSWYPLTWVVILSYWGYMILLSVYWNWLHALGIAALGYGLMILLPIPHSSYKGIFRNRISQLRHLSQEQVSVLRQMLDRAPF